MSKYLLLPLLLVGCREASSAEVTSRATVSGHAQFKDVDLDRDGAHRDVNMPAGQRGTLRVVVHGSGTLDADCADASAGQFTATYDGAMTIESDGSFTAPLYPSNPAVATLSNCAVRSVEVGRITDIEVTAELPSSTVGCHDLCDGRGRDVGEQRCSTSSDRAGCRVPVETAVGLQCEASCVQQATGLVGRGSIDGATMAAVGGGDLTSGNLGDLRARIVFDQMIDGNRSSLE